MRETLTLAHVVLIALVVSILAPAVTRLMSRESKNVPASDVGNLESLLTEPRQTGLIKAVLPLPYGVVDRPFLIYMDDPLFVNLLTQASSLSVYYAESLEDVNEALDKHSYSGLLAMSPMSASGTAAQAIAAFREAHPGALTIYHGWDHRIEISGPKALECEADALLVGGVNTNDFLQFILMLLDRKSTAALPRPSLENYEKLLKDLCPNSAFWDIAEMLRVNQVAPSQYE